ncbi:secreted rhamnogalacturonan acetylesteras-like protein [Microthyrium microscopicum]|uniref:Secreted rhamnogalacturonan acetylesteras-like protein n=1 Tax=Microthyrium microscopicum TaxID=703497 RepID=A0A6A6ULM9_9PEZI|nr:secreted rhamnogalacturonan acetylesteras-like protein [Microthyrium microscopicum]
MARLTLALYALLSALNLTSAATIYLCGDSTMARGNGKIDGWGQHLGPLMTIPVVNKAIGGRSARSYTVEKRFDEVASAVKPGDYVVIEFGHNDGGGIQKNDNGRADCPGTGKETCQTTNAKGNRETVLTFQAYLVNAGKQMIGKGAKVVFSSMTPNNVCEGGSCKYSGSRFGDMAKAAAKEVGEGASYVDHGGATGQEYIKMGSSKVNALFPQDHTHTSPAGAKVVAETFVKAVVAERNVLAQFVKK